MTQIVRKFLFLFFFVLFCLWRKTSFLHLIFNIFYVLMRNWNNFVGYVDISKQGTHFFMKWVSQFGFLAKCIDRCHPCMPSQVELCICSVTIVYLVFNCFAKSKITECFQKQRSEILSRELSVRVAQHAYEDWRNLFKTAGSCNMPVQGTLTNCCAKVFQCRALTGRCSNISRMTAMLERWFHMKNAPCFLTVLC